MHKKPVIVLNMNSGQKIRLPMTENLDQLDDPKSFAELRHGFANAFFGVTWIELADENGNDVIIVPKNVCSVEFEVQILIAPVVHKYPMCMRYMVNISI